MALYPGLAESDFFYPAILLKVLHELSNYKM